MFLRRSIFLAVIGIRISEQIKNSLLVYGLQADQISCVVHDEAANAVLAGECFIL